MVFLDEWSTSGLAAKGLGERRAFEEFLAGNPDLRAEELPSYSDDSKVFFVTRGEVVTSDKRATRAAQPAPT